MTSHTYEMSYPNQYISLSFLFSFPLLSKRGCNFSNSLSPISTHFFHFNLAAAAAIRPSSSGHSDLAAAAIREDWKLCVIAGNISLIDVITHVPILCGESDIPYVYVPSKEDLANAGETKRPTCCVLVLAKPCKGELKPEEEEKLTADYQQVVADVSELASLLY